MITETLTEDPKTNINWHRHPRGCPNYRERWPLDSDTRNGEPLYQVFCLLNTPPVTADEQVKCMASHSGCWRLKGRATRPAAGDGPNPSSNAGG